MTEGRLNLLWGEEMTMANSADNLRATCLLGCLLLLGLQPTALPQDQDKPTADAPKKAALYDPKADARAQVEAASAEAKRQRTRVLVMFGFEGCSWCHKLHALFEQDPEIRKLLRDEYVNVLVDIEAPRAKELLKECKAALAQEELQKGVGFPFLAVLDDGGKVVTAQRSEPLEEGKGHDPVRVKEFLGRWIVPRADAGSAEQASKTRDSTAVALPRVTSPKAYLGFNLGDDYCLANYQQLASYWSKLERESDRLKVVPIGVSAEGRPQLMGIVTSPANHRELARLQNIARRLARAEGVSEAEARRLSALGKAVVWIDGGLHATETLCAQMLMETLYQFVSGTDAETLRILDDVIILFVHANPDGMDLVANWYMREPDPKKRTLAGLPRLYQKYIGHDNNRDFYAGTQAETKNMSRVMYYEWFPQIVFNHHQAGPAGTVLFCPPFRDPHNYHLDPMVISGIDGVGAAMMQRFLAEGKPGATCRSGAPYSGWWNGGLRTTSTFHNMIGLLTETVGNPTPMEIPLLAAKQLPKGDYLAPVRPQKWHFRQSVDYSVTSNKAVLDYASRNREHLLYNIWRMGKNGIERGSRDSWTITPKVVAAAKAAGTSKGGKGKSSDFDRLFRDPANRDPRGYVIPANQPDFLTATKFVNALLETGVKVQRAATAFVVAGKKYPAGSYVVPTAQAFRAHVLDQFEPQDYPNDFAYPGAAPTAPYDMAGWTLAYQMGVVFDRFLDGFDGPFEEIQGPVLPPPARVDAVQGAVGFFLGTRTNDSFRAVNRLLKAGEEVRRLREPFVVDGAAHPPGMFFITHKPTTLPLLEKIAFELGTRFVGSPVAPGKEAVALQTVRVGLWDRYGGSMPSGWTRWLLEQFEFPFQVVFVPELDKGGLRDKFDVLIFVDGALGGKGGKGGKSASGEKGPDEASLPEEFRGRRGNISAATTLPQLRQFLEGGGTVLTIGSSTSLGRQLGLPVANHLITTDKEGTETPLPRQKFYVPPSLLRARVNTAHPLAWGMSEHVDIMFTNSPTFRLSAAANEGGAANSPRPAAWFDSKSPLRSGWAWGQEYLEGGVAVVEAKVGQGRLVLFGPEILFRAQPHGTFKFLFNGIVQAGVRE
jgi:thioredoxin-related protein